MSGLLGAIRRFFRFLFVSALVIIVLGTALGVGAVVYRKPVLEFVLTQTLAFYGYPDAHLTIDDVSADRTRISDIVLDPTGTTIRSIAITYAPQDIVRGHLRSVSVDGVRYEMDLSEAGQGGSASSAINWAKRQTFQSGAVLKVSDSFISLKNTPIGDVVLVGEGQADFSKTPASFDVRLDANSVDASAPLRRFAFNGGGMATLDSIDISGPTIVSLANSAFGGWQIDRLDYDDVARLHIQGQSGAFTLEAPVSLAIRNVGRQDSVAQPSNAPFAVDLETGTAEIQADWSDGFSGAAQLSGASIEIETWQIKGDEIVLSVPFEKSDISQTSILSGRMSDMSVSPRFTPQELNASILRTEEAFDLEATLTPVGQNATVSMTGRYELGGAGVIDIGPSMLTFSSDGLQPANLSPNLSVFQNTKGRVEVSGQIRLSPNEAVKSNAMLRVTDVDTDFTALSFDGISGDLNLLDIFSLRSAPGQVFRAKQMTAPVPLENPTIVLHWVRSGQDPLIRIESANGQFADGTISLEDTPIRLNASSNDFRLLFDKLSLKTLLEDWAGGRVSGSGILSGTIPFTLGSDGPIIIDGALSAEDEGFIKVHWGEARGSLEAQGSEFALMVQALDNFQYRVLNVRVRRPSNDELSLLVQLEGANPEVLNGYPFRFNINLSGDLEKILAAIAKGQSLTEDLLRGRVNDAN